MKNQRKALLVIDPQRIYTEAESELFSPDWKATIERINRLVRQFEKLKLPIVFVRHIHKVDGSDLGRMFDFMGDEPEDFNFKAGSDEVEYDKTLYLPEDYTEIKKNRYSAFVGTGLANRLQRLGVTDVAITGFMTNFCCESSARDAHDLDFFVDFVVDATGTPGAESMDEEQVRKTVAELLGLGFARITTTAEYLKVL